MAESVRRSSPLLIAVAWIIVVAPTTWGLTYTVQNALKIFKGAAAALLYRRLRLLQSKRMGLRC